MLVSSHNLRELEDVCDHVGIGFTTASEIGIWDIFPELVQSVFSANVVAVVFVVSVFLSLVLPKDMDIKTLEG